MTPAPAMSRRDARTLGIRATGLLVTAALAVGVLESVGLPSFQTQAMQLAVSIGTLVLVLREIFRTSPPDFRRQVQR